MGCCRGGGSWAWGMSDGVPGRSVTASQRCRPLSGRQDICGGLPLPPRCPRIYGFVKAWRGAEARPAVGEFDVSWLPRWISALRNRGEAGPGPAGLWWLRVTHRGASGPASFLCCLAPEDFWIEHHQATPSIAHPQPTCVPGCSSLLAFTHSGSSAWSSGACESATLLCSLGICTIAALASVPPAVWGFLPQDSSPYQLLVLTSLCPQSLVCPHNRELEGREPIFSPS